MTADKWVRMVLKVLAAVVIVGMLIVIGGMRSELNDMRNARTPAATDRKQYQAEQYYLRCHPTDKDGTVLPVKDPVMVGLCAPYDTLPHAYRAQGVRPPG